jgi:hypothetical protein
MKSSGEAFLAAALPVALTARRLRPADGMAFLPAALEIVETPPSPIGRAIGARQDHPNRPQQDRAALRDRRRPRHPCE